MLDGLKKVGEMNRDTSRSPRVNTKRRERASTTSKKSISFLEDKELYSEAKRLGWHPNTKTPFLNFNMQYLIRKRKSMTPSLERSG